ncbi:serine/threonine-protein kinase TOUSLED-like [Trifolium pratense]|uniref:serine/threonine-protein kinase TOUSLED-like n=1 Tax=Trifolium pratense TaxID=57577 RepID=UPI001E696BBB|nr:serine/threonine-protein kinase TOUSLED-like [Trifolium pratense]
MEDMERKFEQRFARMEAQNAETAKKIFGILESLIQKVNSIEKPPADSAVIGLGTVTEEKPLGTVTEEKPPSHVGIEANLNGLELTELKKLDVKRRKTISELLISTSKAERKETRLKVRQDSLRLGSVDFISAGTVLSEVWKDGHVFSDLNAKQEKLQEEREAIEQQLLKITPSGATRNNFQEQEAVLEQRDRYELEKERLIREMKRIRDEDGSRFNGFQILKDRYVLLNLLGKGGYGEVYKAFDLAEHRYVACKIHGVNVQWSEAIKQNYIKHTNRECRIHKSLVHDHIVRIWEIFLIDKNTGCSVQEYCMGKDLDALLKASPILPEREARVILVQIFHALVYLNTRTQKIIHYDLKPGNVLFDEFGVAKLTDFGLSKIVENDVGSQGMELTSHGAGTYWYLPPECFDFRKTPLISSKVDVWSAGILFYQMLFGKRPFGHGQTQESILRENTIIEARMVEFPPMPTVSDEAKAFIRRCLTYNQAERPDVLIIAQDPYLTFVTLSPDQESMLNI